MMRGTGKKEIQSTFFVAFTQALEAWHVGIGMCWMYLSRKNSSLLGRCVAPFADLPMQPRPRKGQMFYHGAT